MEARRERERKEQTKGRHKREVESTVAAANAAGFSRLGGSIHSKYLQPLTSSSPSPSSSPPPTGSPISASPPASSPSPSGVGTASSPLLSASPSPPAAAAIAASSAPAAAPAAVGTESSPNITPDIDIGAPGISDTPLATTSSSAIVASGPPVHASRAAYIPGAVGYVAPPTPYMPSSGSQSNVWVGGPPGAVLGHSPRGGGNVVRTQHISISTQTKLCEKKKVKIHIFVVSRFTF
jgi:hypothetical protein